MGGQTDTKPGIVGLGLMLGIREGHEEPMHAESECSHTCTVDTLLCAVHSVHCTLNSAPVHVHVHGCRRCSYSLVTINQ